ncbi:MAG: spermidine/putrescine ABC transporter substrate-binding protein [Deltaproteobacteria bacterium]|nr:spermidine/putrescine ABC transporter substrate-binding protein [Deltaproteobacteria bacterium]
MDDRKPRDGVIFGSLELLREKARSGTHLRIFTWSNYFPDEFIESFTKKTGIKVEVSYFSSNEELFAKLKAGANGYDLIVPSDYMVGQLIRLGMALPLDQAALTNMSHLDDYYRTLPYDPGLKYSIPFTRGSTGIAINTDKVKLDGDLISWSLLFNSPDPKRTSLLDDMREVFAGVLLFSGKPINTHDEPSLLIAKQKITEIKDRIALFSSEPLPLLLQGDVTVAHAYSTHGVLAHRENPAINFYIPKEGATIWTDNFLIPKTNEAPGNAHTFLNYVLDPSNALVLYQSNHLATPNRDALAQMSEPERTDPIFYPPAATLKRMFYLEDLGEAMPTVSRLWTDLKS